MDLVQSSSVGPSNFAMAILSRQLVVACARLRSESDDGHRPSNLARRRPQDQQSCKATATGRAMIEVDSAVTNAAVECDLNCYTNQWCELQLVEVEDAYGPEEEEVVVVL